MPRPDRPDTTLPKLLTPAGGLMLSLVVSGLLWSGVALGMHFVGAF